jgi:hypothetical protein
MGAELGGKLSKVCASIILPKGHGHVKLSYKPCETIHAKIYELHNWLFNELKNKPYLNYEWEMEMKQKHMNQSIVIIIGQSWTSLFQKE